MRARNGSYFCEELCVDGHYIITGWTNDQFCSDMLQISDVKYALHHYLRVEEGFDAVFFLDRINRVYSYDPDSIRILRGEESDAQNGQEKVQEITPDPDEGNPIIRASFLGHRNRLVDSQTPSGQSTTGVSHTSDRIGSLNMNIEGMNIGWTQVLATLRDSPKRCALVLANVDSIISSTDDEVTETLEELQSFHSERHSIVIYIFRETRLSSIYDSIDSSGHSANTQWARLCRNVLIPRIDSDDEYSNRVISLSAPNAAEIRNLLNVFRLRPENSLKIQTSDMQFLAETLAASCARQKWGLVHLMSRLNQYITTEPEKQLSHDNWREFTGELHYLSPLKRLEQMIGLEDEKDDKGRIIREGIKSWIRQRYDLLKHRQALNRISHDSSSRFAPRSTEVREKNMSLNLVLKGGSGTGKTTIAALMGEIYYETEVLPQGHLVVCTASDLVSQNVGGTPGLVRERVQEAMGGVLFIDEAYSLLTDAHGQEAINQLVNDMTRYAGQFAVVLAGYPNQIDQLLNANEGLASRFPNQFTLPDYSADEMKRIFLLMAEHDEEVSISEDLQAKLDDFCEYWVGGRTRGWGNAREAETLLSNMKRSCGSRYMREKNYSEVLELQTVDIPENLQYCLEPRSRSINEALEKIDTMIGLQNVKSFLRMIAKKSSWGADDKAPGNYIFYGDPGTGKTTVAHKLGEILGFLGVLRRKVNNVTECKAADLLSGRVQLRELIEDARGGILFLDEAHQLSENRDGHAIIRELVPLVEDSEIRSDTCFILAGYTVEMRHFLQVDPGLNRRFPECNRIRFDDYSATELTQILAKMAADRGEKTVPAYLERSRSAFERFLEHKPEHFGNGGFIRDVYLPQSISARTERLNRSMMGNSNDIPTKEQVRDIPEEIRSTLTEFDIPKAYERLADPVGKRSQGKERNAECLLSELYGKEEFVEYAKSLQDDEDTVFLDHSVQSGFHYSIAGEEGVGKHTAIEAMSRLLYELGHLDRPDVKYVSKGDLEAKWVGHTADKAAGAIEEALGGTLVVTNPSTMLRHNDTDNSFGPEALGVIAGAMGAHFNDLCIVFIDTQDGLDAFFTAFPGIRSQLSKQFTFENLMPADMLEIFNLKTSESMVFEKTVADLLKDFFLNWVSDRGGLGEKVRTWGNGREVDLLIHDLSQNWKNVGGTTQIDTISVGESSYDLTRRFITREMFPKHVRKYLTANSVLSENALAELDQLTGLKNVKEAVRDIERRIRRMPEGAIGPGLYCFVGNPGVGKTMVAKLMGGILKATGALKQGHVIVKTARQMCDNLDQFEEYIKLAKNGILFIDEAHQLAEDANFRGNSVIKRLLTVVEDPEVMKNTCIILAGYPREMEILVSRDSGLASRTENSFIYFEDYTGEELTEILRKMAAHAPSYPQIGSPYPLRLTEEYVKRAQEIFNIVAKSGDHHFGNARFVRNFLRSSVSEMLKRLDTEDAEKRKQEDSVQDLLILEDIPERYRSVVSIKRKKVRIPKVDLSFEEKMPILTENYQYCFEKLSQSVVYLETYLGNQRTGQGSGTIITESGYVLTCAHVVRGADRIRARVYTPGVPGGDYIWFECELTDTIHDVCDMAILKLPGINYKRISLRPEIESVQPAEETLLLGFPLGDEIAAHQADQLTISHFSGRIASVQNVHGIDRVYIDSTALHGNSGSPVISRQDGRMIGVFSGSVTPSKNGNLDELNFFYPISYFWENDVIDAKN
ncbi:MAG: AAA family ATPase [Lachnospiraceae bacterium]|nr:AAA family ATPase [Lachnospiraceae bacterium]